jgi:hypothetical protein
VKKQTEAVNHIKELLSKRGVTVPTRNLTLEDNQKWVIFDYQGKQIGVDMASGVWKRQTPDDDWHCIGMPCTVSCAIQAVDFLCG